MNSVVESNRLEILEGKSGWVKKRSTSRFPIWHKRFLVLEFCKLKYYHKQEDDVPAGVLDFDLLTINAISKGNNFIINIKASNRKFKFSCTTEQESRDWVYLICLHVQHSNGNKTVFPIATFKNYWKFDRISLQHFEQEVETGDLLLFRGKSALSRMQRAVTRGKYDHVALLIKYSSGKIGLFEVTGVDGVAVLLWDDFIFYQWQNLYSRLTYKKLLWERDEIAVAKLYDFINTVKGMDYRLSAGNLMSKKHDKNPRDKKGFFCSELIATAYKNAGLLPDEKPSSKYWPGDFDDGKITLVEPARLENGLIIDFSLL